jgi:hypothetical protein
MTAASSGRSKSKSIAVTPRSRRARMSPMICASLPEKSRRAPSEASAGTASPRRAARRS